MKTALGLRRGGVRREGVRLLALVLLTVSACGDAEPGDENRSLGPITVTDGAGRTVTIAEPARRVVSMIPSVTEWIGAMGWSNLLVARTDYDTQPALDTLPSVGGGLTPSIEWLASREPDLVIAWPDAPSRSLVSRLEALGIPVYTAPSETIEEAFDVAADVGRLLGRADAVGHRIRLLRRDLSILRSLVDGRGRPDVLYLIGLDPLMAAGPDTFVGQLIDVAGGRNVLADLEMKWPQISLEEVVRRDPDVIIIGTASTSDPVEALRDRPGWRDLTAVREERVHAVDPNLINRPGPNLVRAAHTLARSIHPEAYEGGEIRPATVGTTPERSPDGRE